MVEGLVQDTSKGQMGLNVPHKITLHPLTLKEGCIGIKNRVGLQKRADNFHQKIVRPFVLFRSLFTFFIKCRFR